MTKESISRCCYQKKIHLTSVRSSRRTDCTCMRNERLSKWSGIHFCITDLHRVCDLVIDISRPSLHVKGCRHWVEVALLTNRFSVSEVRLIETGENKQSTFKNRLSPIQVRCIIEVLPVEVQTLPEFHQFSKFHNQIPPIQARFTSFWQCYR